MYKYFVGIDAGGTKTLVKVLGSGGDILFIKEYSSGNFRSIGIEKFKLLISTILSELETNLKITNMNFTDVSLCFGAAGVDRECDKKFVYEVIESYGFNGKLQVYNDAVIGLVGGNNSIDGAVLIAGTGSIALGYKNGQEYRVGGWGHLLGDEGSGYKIAIQILGEILKSLDGRNDDLKDSNNLLNLINLNGSDEILEYVYDKDKDKSHIAKLTKVFLENYYESEIVRRVLNNNLEENLIMINALSNRMEDKSFNLSLCGGLFEKSDLYYELMKEKINCMNLEIKTHRPQYLPVDGALILAKNWED